jgi:hypothetical protein
MALAHDLEELLDTDTVALAAIDRLLATPTLPLESAKGSLKDPGAYLLFALPGAHPLYDPLTGRHPVYIGAASSLSDRLRAHARSLDSVADLSAADFTVATIATAHPAAAEFLERALIEVFRPVWNQPACRGFGARPQGRVRAAHHLSPWDTLHPGRCRGRVPHHAPGDVAAFARAWIGDAGASLGMWPPPA